MIEVVHWNPSRRPTTGLFRRVRRARPVNNFGDLLGPLIVDKIARARGLDIETNVDRRMLAVGSILTMARKGDVVWGSGVNGKHLTHEHPVQGVDFRAVRGPRSAAFLRSLGAEVPDVFGDPGLLVAELWPVERRVGERATGVLYAPNLHDLRAFATAGAQILDPTRPVRECLLAIAQSEFVVASSLHAAIVADSYGVPARVVRSQKEPVFKYQDYFEGTGRFDVKIADSVEEAVALGPHASLSWSSAELLKCFPEDLWDETS